MKDEEIVRLIMSEIEIYLSFDSMQKEYAEKGIKNALRKIKKECSQKFADWENTQMEQIDKSICPYSNTKKYMEKVYE
ncbi:hypothetical protein U1329_09180 [Enterococcus cecorum]|uniref:hypothetical protein n=1 Tax=Enterococcus cecorum TaxID=44008 RepID=UPI00148C4F8A|nr:hypothetical protein [Enterococcus cecorum]MDZ5440674.1 hypothetical protein [Enterococcus cecorum]MDZ5498189.1 hypothetical protein [Enterococcus cecorum]MDZ5500759.1 hypothetical protein [Enterococcus cecorum]MDZ5501766.1 hypothetical protein [Enterococcus cecorum]MDZ5563207.1 hypothetical protein [Enterococcus cecorum]